jgi:hypothetical protein
VKANLDSLLAKQKDLELQIDTANKQLIEAKLAKHRPDLELKAKLRARIKEVRGCAGSWELGDGSLLAAACLEGVCLLSFRTICFYLLFIACLILPSVIL